MSSNEKLAELYDEAADYLAVHGWCQERAFLGDKACLIGATEKAGEKLFGGKDLFYDSIRLGIILEPFVYISSITIREYHMQSSAWNDQPGRTQAEVEDIFRNTAKDLRNGITESD